DITLIITILLSVLIVMLESVASIRAEHGELIRNLEWMFTILFTIEYVLRLLCVRSPLSYAKSFYGLVDLISIVPTYLSFFFPGTQYLLVIRTLRILRVFRVLKLVQYINEANTLARALRASRRKIFVFIYTVCILAIIAGSLMYIIEGEENGFTSIPVGIYWAIVTVTTVGFGDITPSTSIGQMLSVVLMILGYGIIAVPTGIVTSELTKGEMEGNTTTRCCRNCTLEGHDSDAVHCKRCGALL
ncbi:MAG: ion transporter, partial [Calditrichota bacterium]